MVIGLLMFSLDVGAKFACLFTTLTFLYVKVLNIVPSVTWKAMVMSTCAMIFVITLNYLSLSCKDFLSSQFILINVNLL
jgi:hypothetical protein